MNRPGPGFSPAFAVFFVPGSTTEIHQVDNVFSRYLAVVPLEGTGLAGASG
jgi:hypothetical protein